jgi:molybdopterin molybdotransferase
VLVTGDEVIPPGAALAPGQIFNSSGPMIAALVRDAGGDAIDLGLAGDTVESMRDRLAAIRDIDLLITTGGVSVGDFDVVKDVLRELGDVDLWSVRIKPGKPLAFGHIGPMNVLGLPGNPVAAVVAFLQFARPTILTMLGRRDVAMPAIEATARDRIANRGRRTLFARVVVERSSGGYVATLAGGQGSAMIASLARANGLLVVPEDVDVVEPGDAVTVQMPGWDLA